MLDFYNYHAKCLYQCSRLYNSLKTWARLVDFYSWLLGIIECELKYLLNLSISG